MAGDHRLVYTISYSWSSCYQDKAVRSVPHIEVLPSSSYVTRQSWASVSEIASIDELHMMALGLVHVLDRDTSLVLGDGHLSQSDRQFAVRRVFGHELPGLGNRDPLKAAAQKNNDTPVSGVHREDLFDPRSGNNDPMLKLVKLDNVGGNNDLELILGIAYRDDRRNPDPRTTLLQCLNFARAMRGMYLVHGLPMARGELVFLRRSNPTTPSWEKTILRPRGPLSTPFLLLVSFT